MNDDEIKDKFKMIADAIDIIIELMSIRKYKDDHKNPLYKCNGLLHREFCCLKKINQISNK